MYLLYKGKETDVQDNSGNAQVEFVIFSSAVKKSLSLRSQK
jgi:hypothetical protein